MPNPFQNAVSPAADTWVNRLFGPPIAVQTQQYQAMEDERTRQRDEAILGPATRKAFEMRSANPQLSPAQVILQLQGTPEGQAVFDAGPDYIKKLSDSVQATVPGQTEFMGAGNTIFGNQPNYDPSKQNQLYVAGEGGKTQTVINPGGNPEQITTPGQAFPPGYMGGSQGNASYNYPSVTNNTSTTPNTPWMMSLKNAPQEYQQAIQEAASKYQLPPDMLTSLLMKESRFNPTAVSPKGAVGLAQFMPETAQQYGVDPLDPLSSIDGAAHYMRDLLDQNDGNFRYALMSYNWGPGNVGKWKARGANPAETPDETDQYVRDISGDNGPVQNIQYRPGMTFQKTVQSSLPTNRPVTVRDLNTLGNRNKAIYFAGVGLAPFLTEIGKEFGAQIDPSVANDFTSGNHQARNYLRTLSAAVSNYGTLAGGAGGRLKGPWESWTALDPSGGGVINDPVDAIDTAMSLQSTLTDRVHELDQYNYSNTPKANLDNYQRERDAALRVLNILPRKDEMEEMRGQFVRNQHVMTPAIFMNQASGYVSDIVKTGSGMVADQVNGLGQPQVKPTPAGQTPGVATPAGSGGPRIVTRGKDGKLTFGQ